MLHVRTKILRQKMLQKSGLNVTLKSQKRSVVATLKADLARSGCGMNTVEGALDCPRVVLPNSEIKSGTRPSGFCENSKSL